MPTYEFDTITDCQERSASDRTASSDGAERVRERTASTEQNPPTTKAHKPDGEP